MLRTFLEIGPPRNFRSAEQAGIKATKKLPGRPTGAQKGSAKEKEGEEYKEGTACEERAEPKGATQVRRGRVGGIPDGP